MPKFALRAFLFISLTVGIVITANAFSSFHFSHLHSESFFADSNSSQFGSDIKTADLNKDGHLDLIISAPYFSSEDKSRRGKVKIHFGPFQNDENTATLTVLGANENDLLGTSIAAGDVNGDGIDDLMIGAYQAKTKDNYRPGAAYMFMGRKHFFLDTYDLSVYQPDLSIYGPHNNSYFGSSILIEDMNGDKDLDMVIGAPLSRNSDGLVTGNVYVVAWQNVFNTNPFYDLSANLPDILISGQKQGSLFGSSLASGNINRNSEPDLLVSAYAETVGNKVEAGAVHLFSDFNQNSTHRKIPHTTFTGQYAYDWFGFSLNVSNLDGDRYDDVFISSFSFKKTLKKGVLWIVKGSDLFDIRKEFTFRDIDKDHFVKVDGFLNNHILGNSAIVSDLNRDSMNELVVSNPNILAGGAESVVSVYDADDFVDKNYVSILSAKAKTTIKSTNKQDWFGHKVLTADMNRDGRKDLVVSAPYAQAGGSGVKIFFMIEGPGAYVEKELVQAEIEPEYDAEKNLTRGEVVSKLMSKFDLKNKYSDFIDSCYQNLDFCTFVFSSQSRFDDISFEPNLILYPDVDVNYEYYEDITLATILGLVHGNISDKQSPFKPNLHVSRIQALKMIMEAAGLERENLFSGIIKDMGGDEVLSEFSDFYEDVSEEFFHMWWYPRYVNFAYKIGVLPRVPEFRPDHAITQKEFDELLDKVYNFAR